MSSILCKYVSRLTWAALFLLGAGSAVAEIRFLQNRGQWKNGDYKAAMNGGDLFFRNGNLVWLNRPTLHQMKDMAADKASSYKTESIFLSLIDGNVAPASEGNEAFGTVYHYFRSGGAEGVRHVQATAYAAVEYKAVYPGINLIWYEKDETLEFDFRLEAGADPACIGMKVQGAVARLEDGKVRIEGVLGAIVMSRPLAYQTVAGKRRAVACRYRMEHGVITFTLGRYDRSLPLTIDPQLAFSTLSGSQADNWGTTATFDKAGHAYGGGMVYDNGFPVTPGVVDNSFNGLPSDNNVDLGIQKFSPDGRRLLYATYIGGNGVDIPHSMVCDELGNLIILGSTGSSNYPVTGGSFGGGPRADPFNYPFPFLQYSQGSDLFLTKLNPDGNRMLASRYVGGRSTDGMLDQAVPLLYNYGDQFRGEVICDRFNNIYVASNTRSAGIATQGAFQTNFQGGYDALVARFRPDLATSWLTYLGGQADDAAYSLRCLNSGKLVVCGGTASANFPTTHGSYNPIRARPTNAAPENQVDAWVALLSPNGGQLLGSTYVSSAWYDQAFLVEEKRGESIYIYGQTRGNLERREGSFGSVTGGMFVYQFDSTLSVLQNACRFGRRANSPELSPTAMTVDSCGQVYLAGWGALLGRTWPITALTTSGLPVSRDAAQGNTDGNDFYFMVLTSDFRAQKYATFFGGEGSEEHVDGGTSRFDRNGVIYQAVCANCGGANLFPTSPGAYSRANGSFNCNLGLVKFEFSPLAQPLELSVLPDSLCPGQTLTINHNAANNNAFVLTVEPGGYNLGFGNPVRYRPEGDSISILVRLTGNGPGCANLDTLEKSVRLLRRPTIADTATLFCPGDTVHIHFAPRYRYVWSPPDGLETDTGAYQTITDGVEHRYQVIAQDRRNGCRDTAAVTLRNRSGSIDLMYRDVTEPCVFERSVLLSVDSQFRPNYWLVNGVEYENMDSLRITYSQDSLYASVRSGGNCRLYDSIVVRVPLKRPSFDTSFSQRIRGTDCSKLGRLLRANGRPDEAFWLMDGATYTDFEVLAGPEEKHLVLVQTTSGCADTTYIHLPKIGFVIPNVLTLNNDGTNDRVEVENLDFEAFNVYNRWGESVYRQQGSADGKVESVLRWAPKADMAAGTYFFNIKLRDSDNCKGWIELVK